MPSRVQSKKQQAAESPKKQYRVSPGRNVTTREPNANGDPEDVVYAAGEEIELSEQEANELLAAGAVMEAERRKTRDGQVSRMRAQIEQQRQTIEDLKTRLAAKDDPNFESAGASLRARGDNYQARNEPHPVGVPADVLDAADRARMVVDFNLPTVEASDAHTNDDDLAGGMKGLQRGRASDETVKTPAPVAGVPTPATPTQGGQSVMPGTGEATGEPGQDAQKSAPSKAK